MRFSRSNQDVVNQSVVEISNRQLFDLDHDRAPMHNGPLDGKLVRRWLSQMPLCSTSLTFDVS